MIKILVVKVRRCWCLIVVMSGGQRTEVDVNDELYCAKWSKSKDLSLWIRWQCIRELIPKTRWRTSKLSDWCF